jgi:hypothetical protein
MRKAIALAFFAFALACSDPPPGPSPTPPSTSRVVLSGRVYSASSGGPDHYPVGTSISAGVHIVEGVNAGRGTTSANGGYTLTDLEPGTMTLFISTSGYREVRRTVEVRENTTLDIGLEPGPWPGFVLSGIIREEWGEPVGDVGLEAVKDGRVFGGDARNSDQPGGYRIPTLPVGDYLVRVRKGGYLDPQNRVTVNGDTTFDFVISRSRILLFGRVNEAPPCTGAIEGVEVEVVTGPDGGAGVVTTASGYRTSRTINWGTFRVRASKNGYVPVEVAMDVPYPGSRCFSCPFDAPVEVQQDFVLQRTGGC